MFTPIPRWEVPLASLGILRPKATRFKETSMPIVSRNMDVEYGDHTAVGTGQSGEQIPHGEVIAENCRSSPWIKSHNVCLEKKKMLVKKRSKSDILIDNFDRRPISVN